MSSSTPSKPAEPSASLPPATRKRVQACFERGKLLTTQKQQFDYAHDMFAQCVTLDPGNLCYAEAMLANLRAKFGNDKKAAGRGNVSGFKKAISRQEWSAALQLGVEQLRSNPWQVAALRGMAEVCAGLHFNDTELVYLKQALESDPKDADLSRHCARSLARMGQFDQAIACWHRVEMIRPGDKEVAQMIAELSENKIWQGADQREQAGRPRSPAAPAPQKAEAPPPEQPAAAAVKLSPRQLLEQAIAANPADVASYLQLSELLVKQDRLGDAESLLERCLNACGGDPRVQEHLAAVKSLIAEKNAAAPPSQPHARRVPWKTMTAAFVGAAVAFPFLPSQRRMLFANVVIVVALIALRAWRQRPAVN